MENKKSHKKSFRIYLSIVAVLYCFRSLPGAAEASAMLILIIFPNLGQYLRKDYRVVSLFRGRMDDCGRDSGGACCGCAGMQFADSGVQTFGKVLPGSEGIFWFFAWTLLAVFVIMTLNCTMIYHGSTFSEKYFGEEEAQEQTTQERTEELLRIYNDIVRHCNELSEVMERDDSGAVVYSGGVDSKGNVVDMEDKAIDVMQSLGKTYDQLDGYYPRPKAMFFSNFMCQMYMCGYYFPFSMEANYNDVMYIMENRQPCVMSWLTSGGISMRMRRILLHFWPA